MPGAYRRVVQTIDSHTEGNSTRVITGGCRIPPAARSWRSAPGSGGTTTPFAAC
jgi:hypothetical protein